MILRKLRAKLFRYIVYPIFQEPIDLVLDSYRLGQVNGIHVSNGVTYVTVNKHYHKNVIIQFYQLGQPMINIDGKPSEEYDDIFHVHKIIANGKVINSSKYQSIVLLTQQYKVLKIGDLAKTAEPSYESALFSLKTRC